MSFESDDPVCFVGREEAECMSDKLQIGAEIGKPVVVKNEEEQPIGVLLSVDDYNLLKGACELMAKELEEAKRQGLRSYQRSKRSPLDDILAHLEGQTHHQGHRFKRSYR